MDILTVHLKNQPFQANYWYMTIFDYLVPLDIAGRPINRLISKYPSELFDWELTFDIPSDWTFPLRFELGVNQNFPYTSIRLYVVQSVSPILPYYKEIFIPSHGDYYYNVTTEQFEKIPLPGVSDFGVKEYIKV